MANATDTDTDLLIPNWEPLERLIGKQCCEEFMWIMRRNGLEHYKHIDSRKYLILDAAGHCYSRHGDQLVRLDKL